METIQWFHFHSIVEHTEVITEKYISLITLLLKFFAMFQMRLFGYKRNEEGKKWSLYLSSVKIMIESPVYF